MHVSFYIVLAVAMLVVCQAIYAAWLVVTLFI
jgi:hypothetical protein